MEALYPHCSWPPHVRTVTGRPVQGSCLPLLHSWPHQGHLSNWVTGHLSYAHLFQGSLSRAVQIC